MNVARAESFAALWNTERDAKRLQITALLALALLYAHVALVVLNRLPAWSLSLSAPILIVRWMLATHELFHLRTAREVDPLTWLMPLLLTPFSIGYREHRAMHRGHHQFMATPADPEYFQLRGNRLIGFLNALTAPEQGFFRWIARSGADRAFLLGAGLRGALFLALAWAMGPLFFWYWGPARLAHGMAFFSFFYLLHRRGEDFGVYPAHIGPVAARIYALLFGREALLATCHHDLHHGQPRVSALRLPQLRDSP